MTSYPPGSTYGFQAEYPGAASAGSPISSPMSTGAMDNNFPDSTYLQATQYSNSLFAHGSSNSRTYARMNSYDSRISDNHDHQVYTSISQADHDTLVRTRNNAYLARLQRIEQLDQERRDLLLYKTLYEDLSARIPQLIGMAQEAAANPGDNAQTAVVPGIARWSSSRVTLGLGQHLPDVPPLPPGILYRTRDDWNRATKPKAAKQGPQPDGHNVAQRFIEDENGEPISGGKAREARTMLHTLLHSLVWSGQAAASAQTLGNEARIYLHVNLARRFPMLLFCEEGTWKIDLFISQQYPGFAKTYLDPNNRRAIRAKPECSEDKVEFDDDMGTHTGIPAKRSAGTSHDDVPQAKRSRKAASNAPDKASVAQPPAQRTSASAPDEPAYDANTGITSHHGAKERTDRIVEHDRSTGTQDDGPAAAIQNTASPPSQSGHRPTTAGEDTGSLRPGPSGQETTPGTTTRAPSPSPTAAVASAVATGARPHSSSGLDPDSMDSSSGGNASIGPAASAHLLQPPSAATNSHNIASGPSADPSSSSLTTLGDSDEAGRRTGDAHVIDGDPLITTVLSSDSNSSATGAEVGSRASIPPTSAAAAKSANEASETEVVDGNQSRLQADSSLPSDCVPVRANVVCDVDSSEPQLGGGSTRANATPRYGPGEFVPVPKSMPTARRSPSPPRPVVASPNIVLPSGTQAAQSDAPQLPSPGTSTSQAASSTAKTKQSSKNNSSTKASTESKPGTINEKQVHLRCYLEVHGQDALLSDWEKAYKADRKDPAKLTALRADVEQAKKRDTTKGKTRAKR